jgi:hypothetical protein
MSINSLYFALTGLAYQRGVDQFELVMPKDCVARLHRAWIATKGFKAIEKGSFVRWIIAVAGREDRKLRRNHNES